MLQSTHYELKLVEGSDIVNPLVIDRPNYETIDGVMYENESKSIGNATELKSGTIHALTRTKGNQRFFCFTATSNYDAGDTFTVDSVPVTALLPNGTALPDNAYVVNGTVLCSLIGTLLTVYTVGSAIADDALRLGGELPSYYATASDLATVETTANAASTLSINNSNQISEINSNLAIEKDTYTDSALGGYVICKKTGNVVSVQYGAAALTSSIALNTNYTLCTIDAKYRPNNAITVAVSCNNDLGVLTNSVYQLQIDSSGVVAIKTGGDKSTTANHYMGATVSFIQG